MMEFTSFEQFETFMRTDVVNREGFILERGELKIWLSNEGLQHGLWCESRNYGVVDGLPGLDSLLKRWGYSDSAFEIICKCLPSRYGWYCGLVHYSETVQKTEFSDFVRYCVDRINHLMDIRVLSQHSNEQEFFEWLKEFEIEIAYQTPHRRNTLIFYLTPIWNHFLQRRFGGVITKKQYTGPFGLTYWYYRNERLFELTSSSDEPEHQAYQFIRSLWVFDFEYILEMRDRVAGRYLQEIEIYNRLK